jgi:hypothetical protein
MFSSKNTLKTITTTLLNSYNKSDELTMTMIRGGAKRKKLGGQIKRNILKRLKF